MASITSTWPAGDDLVARLDLEADDRALHRGADGDGAGRQVGVGGARRSTRRAPGSDLPSSSTASGSVESSRTPARPAASATSGRDRSGSCRGGRAARRGARRRSGCRPSTSGSPGAAARRAGRRCSSPRPRCGTRRAPSTAAGPPTARSGFGVDVDDLRQQRVEVRARGVAGVAERVGAHAGADRRLERGEDAARRLRRPVGPHRLQVHPRLDGDAPRRRHGRRRVARARPATRRAPARAGAGRGRRRSPPRSRCARPAAGRWPR